MNPFNLQANLRNATQPLTRFAAREAFIQRARFAETPWADVTAAPYRARGNGRTDDSTAIQKAMDAINALGGGVVYLPTGTYIISAGLNLGSFTTLRGDGWGATFIKVKDATNVTGGIQLASGVHQVYLQDFRLNGNATTTGTGIRGIDDNTQFHIRGVFVEKFVKGLDLNEANTGGTGLVIAESYFIQNTEYGARISTDSEMMGCFIGQNGDGVSWDACGLFVDGWGVRMIGNHIWGTNGHGVIFNWANANRFVGGNTVEESQWHGLAMFGRANHHQIEGNLFTDNGLAATNTYDGVYIDVPAGGQVCEANIVKGNTFKRRLAAYGDAPTATQLRYCVNEVAGANYNLFEGNVFGASAGTAYATGGLNKTGANSVGANNIG